MRALIWRAEQKAALTVVPPGDQWTTDPARTALVIVDMQRFTLEPGVNARMEPGEGSC